MNRLHQWLNTGLLAVCVAALVLLLTRDRDLGVECLEPQEVAQQFFKINQPGYCVAVAPASLDRD